MVTFLESSLIFINIVGDLGYSSDQFLLTPYKLMGCTPVQRRFINAHSSVRTLIENLFGILSCKFGLIKDFRPTTMDIASKVILSISYLWNLLQLLGDHRHCVNSYEHGGEDKRDFAHIVDRPDVKHLDDGDEKMRVISEWLEEEGLFK